jgi:hypothetical protein
MRHIPFTAHVKLVPEQPGKRFEYIRSLQKWSHMLYEQLSTVSTLNLADSGGGQHMNFSGGGAGGMSGIVSGFAVKPQMGETPAQLMITGFYEQTTTDYTTQPTTQRISGGETYTENAAAAPLNNPNTWVDTGVKAVKTLIESAIAVAVPSAIKAKVFRIDYAGVVYGDKGYHFPA